jgi:hypothetical protein
MLSSSLLCASPIRMVSIPWQRRPGHKEIYGAEGQFDVRTRWFTMTHIPEACMPCTCTVFLRNAWIATKRRTTRYVAAHSWTCKSLH